MIDRRQFLAGFLATAGSFVASAALKPFLAMAQPSRGSVSFDEGVASGDPMPDAVVLWTRAVDPTAPGAAQEIILQVASDAAFAESLVERSVTALPQADHTVRVFVDGLRADCIYFYRFIARAGGMSRTGRTRTAPSADSDRAVVLAFTSCQNYEVGFYQGWRRMIVDDEAAPEDGRIDVILQVGDFIYEGGGYAVPDPDFRRVHGNSPDLLDRQGRPRRIPPFPSGGTKGDYAAKAAKTIDDFRLIYRTYLRDPNLQDARARWPFICTWDDHEFADNNWQSQTNLGARQTGRLAASQAWFEYIPAALSTARPAAGVAPKARDFVPTVVRDVPFGAPGEPSPDEEVENQKAISSLTIYRALSFGKHAKIIVTDDRSYRTGSPQPQWWIDKHLEGMAAPNGIGLVAILDAGRSANGGNPPPTVTIEGKDYPNPKQFDPPGTMLGDEQKKWWKATVAGSRKTWKFWLSGVPVAGLAFDFDAIPWKSVPRVMLSADTWTGYPGERAELLEYLRDREVENVVVLSGDMHTHMVAGLKLDPTDPEGRPVCSEFSVTGLSSESLFRIVRHRHGDDKRVAGLFFAGQDQGVEVLNNTLMNGVISSIVYSLTGSTSLAGWVAAKAANSELRYIDSSANGYGIVRASAGLLRTEMITIDPPVADLGTEPAPVRRRAVFEQKPGENAPRLVAFDGQPAFGMPEGPSS